MTVGHLRRYGQNTKPSVGCGHGVDRIAHEVVDDLLELHSIAVHRGLRPIEHRPQRYAGTLNVSIQEQKDLIDRVIDPNLRKSGLGVAHQGPEAGNDVSRPASLLDDACCGLTSFTRLCRIPRESSKARLRTHDDPGQRLIYLVNNGAREFA